MPAYPLAGHPIQAVAVLDAPNRQRLHRDDSRSERSRNEMCLNCGCMRAHDDMGKPGVNITYEVVKAAADANAMTIDATLAMIARTSDKDRGDHPAEYDASHGVR